MQLSRKISKPQTTGRRTTGREQTKLGGNSWARARTVATRQTDKDGGSVSRPEGTKRKGENI